MVQIFDVQQMLIKHMDDHMELGLALAVYVFRWPTKYLRLMQYKDRPFRQLILDSPGLLSILLEIELRPNILDPNVVDTWITGDIAEFMNYKPM